MSVVSDIVINKRLLKLSPARIEHRRSQLSNYNPVGVASLLISLVVAVLMAFGLAGPFGITLAPYVSAGLGFVLPPMIAVVTRGQRYLVLSTAQEVVSESGIVLG